MADWIDVEGVAVDPAVVNGRTDQYHQFLTRWAETNPAADGRVQAQLNAVIVAELQAAGTDLVNYVRAMIDQAAPQEKALNRLLNDLLAHLEGHDCYREDCLRRMQPDDPICPSKARLAGRIRLARRVLGLDPAPGAGEEAAP